MCSHGVSKDFSVSLPAMHLMEMVTISIWPLKAHVDGLSQTAGNMPLSMDSVRRRIHLNPNLEQHILSTEMLSERFVFSIVLVYCSVKVFTISSLYY